MLSSPRRPPVDARDREPFRCWSETEVRLERPVLEPGLDRAEEPRSVRPVDQPVVVGQREVAHRADRDRLAEVRVVDDDRALDDRPGAEDADLRLVDDRCVEERTRNNKITPDELGGGTFTLTNTGSRGALFDTPIVNQPQVGILGTGAVVKRPVVVVDRDLGETIAIRSMCYLALSYDHRLVDGADAARFLTTIKARLEEGAFESDLGL